MLTLQNSVYQYALIMLHKLNTEPALQMNQLATMYVTSTKSNS